MIKRSLIIGALVVVGCTSATANDWPSWRGPEQTGMSREKAVVTSWSLDGDNLLWKSDAGGRTTPIVMDGRVFMIVPAGECRLIGSGRQDCVALQERVVCLDADTGAMLWEHRFNVFHTDIVENRIGWTSVVGDPRAGNVYAHGTGGELFGFDRDGKLLWKRSLTEEFGRISGYGGRLHTPIVDGQRLIVSFLSSSWGKQGRPTHRYLAVNKMTGQVIWWAEPGGKPLDTTYAVPAIAVIDGCKVLIAPAADGNIYGMRSRTGEKIWTFRLSKRGLNSSAVTDGKYAYVCHSEENIQGTEMGSVVCLDASGTGDITDTGVVWRRDGLRVGYASPAIANGRLYVVDNSANLICLDAKNGATHWLYNIGRVGKGSPTVTADGVIYVGGQTGVFRVLRDEGDKCVALDTKNLEREDGLVDEIFGSPAIANGRVYFQSRYGTYCLGRRDADVETIGQPVNLDRVAFAADQNASGDPGRGTIQLTPREVTLHPGDTVKFGALQLKPTTVGAWLVDVGAKYAVQGIPGTIGDDRILTVGAVEGFATGTVTCEMNGVTATSRVRITPKVPFLEDFESMPIGSVPPGWIGAGAKTKIVERDGGRVLRKIAPKEKPSPPFMRLRVYATPPIEGGYTVQADLLGTDRQAKRLHYQADMGLINSRYRMIMLGKAQSLRVESWSPVPRLRKDAAFQWLPDTWYTMKFDVKLDGDKAIVRGKVWPKESTEPTDWTIQIVDPYPNVEGSAGLYGYSNGTTAKSDGTEIFYDNFQVMPND